MGQEVQNQEVQRHQSNSFTNAVSSFFQTQITGGLKEQNSYIKKKTPQDFGLGFFVVVLGGIERQGLVGWLVKEFYVTS